MWTIFLLLIGVFIFFFWYTRMHLKEQALALVIEALAKKNYQLLDETVSFMHMRIQRQGWGLILVHTFEFHYTDAEQQRQIAQIIRYGNGWLNIEFNPTSHYSAQDSERKVIPFPGTYHHD